MRALRYIRRSLNELPRTFTADGRPLGLGLDAALKAQRAIGNDDKIVTDRRTTEPRPVARV